MKTHFAHLILAASLAILIVSGCSRRGIGTDFGAVAITSAPGQFEGPLAVDIENRIGSITLIVDRTISAPVVTAVCTDAQGQSRPVPWAAADIEDTQPTPVLRVLVMPEGAAPAMAADVTILIPSCAGVRIRNSGGPVTATGLSGAVDIQNGSGLDPGGDVRVTFATPVIDPVLVRTSTHGLKFDMPPAAVGAFSIQSGAGQIIVTAGKDAVADAKSDAYRWSAVFGTGGNDVKLIADEGSVQLRVIR